MYIRSFIDKEGAPHPSQLCAGVMRNIRFDVYQASYRKDLDAFAGLLDQRTRVFQDLDSGFISVAHQNLKRNFLLTAGAKLQQKPRNSRIHLKGREGSIASSFEHPDTLRHGQR